MVEIRPDQVADEAMGLAPTEGFTVGQPVRLKATVARFLPEHKLALIEVDGPVKMCGLWVPIADLEPDPSRTGPAEEAK